MTDTLVEWGPRHRENNPPKCSFIDGREVTLVVVSRVGYCRVGRFDEEGPKRKVPRLGSIHTSGTTSSVGPTSTPSPEDRDRGDNSTHCPSTDSDVLRTDGVSDRNGGPRPDLVGKDCPYFKLHSMEPVDPYHPVPFPTPY